eukprot:11750891-Ditylum_brightwellii.AAC.1
MHSNTAPPPETSQGNHAGHQTAGHVTPNPPHGIPQQVHDHYPTHPYYSTTYTPAPTPSPNTDQLWPMYQQFATQQQQHISPQNGQDRNQATNQTV